MCKLFVSDKNTWNHITVCQQMIIFVKYDIMTAPLQKSKTKKGSAC